MPNYRRYYIPGSLVFITCVTRNRRQYLKSDENVYLFFQTLNKVKEIYPFGLLAYIILPDHFHWIMRTEDASGNFSKPLQNIKWNFTYNYKHLHRIDHSISIWQRGFWDHIIRDEDDLENHFHYIHWNPIKHGYVDKPEDWPHSTFNFWVNKGFYEPGWGYNEIPGLIPDLNFE